MNECKTTNLEQGWDLMHKMNLEGLPQTQLIPEDDVMIYTAIYKMCTPKPSDDYTEQQLYGKFRETFEEYITSMVLPLLRGKKNDMLLQEVAKRWKNHIVMTLFLSKYYHYLGRYFFSSDTLPMLEASSYSTFYQLVYGEFNNQVRDAVISMISRHREGEQIDQILVKDIVDIYVEMGEDSMNCYEKRFEEALLKSTLSFYSGVALNWITSYSYEDYMLKVEVCLKEEEERISYYLQGSCQNKLLEVLRHKLLAVYASKLDEKKQLDDRAAWTNELINLGILEENLYIHAYIERE